MRIDPNYKRAGWIALGACGPLAWMLMASLVWSGGSGKPYTPLGWWHGTQWWSDNWWCKLFLALGAIVPSILAGLLLLAWWQSQRTKGPKRRLTTARGAIQTLPLPTQRGVTDNHGTSHFRSPEAIARRFDGPVAPHGGIVVGELYDPRWDYSVADLEFDPRDDTTWGLGGKAAHIVDSCTKGARAFHSGLFGPSGSGKTSELITKGLAWTGSSVFYDPKIEIGPMLDRVLRRHFRKRVFHVGLPNPTKGIKFTGLNVLAASLDTEHPEAELQVRRVINRIYNTAAANAAMEKNQSGSSADPYWGLMGRALVTACLAHIAWSDPDDVEISLATLVEVMHRPEADMRSILHAIYAGSSSPLARREAGSFMDAQAQITFSSIRLNAVAGVEWLFTQSIRDMVSTGEFDPKWLLLGNCTVFLSVHLSVIEDAPMLPQVLVGCIADTLIAADGHTNGLVALFLDEFDTLKTLGRLKVLRDLGRYYNAVMHVCLQSLNQLFATWGEEQAKAWLESFSWAAFVGTKVYGSGRMVSEALGTHGALAYSEGDNQGVVQPRLGFGLGSASRGQNVNVHEISHQLMTAARLQQELDARCLVVVIDYGMPMICGRSFWWWRPEIVELMKQYRGHRR